jgi:Zn-dependent peptidase ImmA (M78 family)
MMEHVSPKGINASKASVENFAEKMAQKFNFNAGDSIEEFVKSIGGKLVIGSSGHGDGESGSIVAHDMKNWTIYLSAHTSVKRDKFTIAHEIGHLLLHFSPIKAANKDAIMRATRWVDVDDKSQRRAEWEANWFAAGFLMPKTEFTDFYKKYKASMSAQHFGVSMSAIEIRANSLGI